MIDFQKVGRLPAPQDNCAIATRKLAAGTLVCDGDGQYAISHTLLEGHRFAVKPIPAGTSLLSWGMPFGRALHDILPGEYVCNDRVLRELRGRTLDFELPPEANFEDHSARYQFDAADFRPAPALRQVDDPRRFMGIQRPGRRGVGTRNMIVLLGVNALVAAFVKRLEQEVRSLGDPYAHVDGIVAVAHTEGSQVGNNNEELLLRTLAGFMVHPNVAAVLLVDAGGTGVTHKMVIDYARQNGYQIDAVPRQTLSLRGPFAIDLGKAVEIVKDWLPVANKMQRTAQPLSQLKIALQCGGSDAFSGISGNPLVALVGKKVIAAGGAALLAETDELIGAEAYVLQKVSDEATVERFLTVRDRFQKRVERHGFSAQGNPSGGNRYRGLYNIYLKSLGAATKRHPDVRLDGVLDYGALMGAPGYYFMDSPGNDLESIAGQVASGCNLIFFVTGNGSITNFPFVPTIKVVTTSERFRLLSDEMDINAGAYLEGMPLEELAQNTLDLALDIASGRQSAGERAGHAQVQIWRNWRQLGGVDLLKLKNRPRPSGRPLSIRQAAEPVDFAFLAWKAGPKIASDRVGLIVPSSLCSAQIAAMAARRLNELQIGNEKQISQFVSLAHTEGCGSSSNPEFIDAILGYLAHPMVATALILEHGCEITHNDFWRRHLAEVGMKATQIGWASVQLDGGIARVMTKIEKWFISDLAKMPAPQSVKIGFTGLRLGIMSEDSLDPITAESLKALIQQVTAGGGSVTIPANDPLAANQAFLSLLKVGAASGPTLAYAQRPTQAGVHLMANPTTQWAETMAGLGATGVELILAHITRRTQQGHPFIPVLQVSADEQALGSYAADIDLHLSGSAEGRLAQLLASMKATLSQQTTVKLTQSVNIGFQITRGELGVSL